MTTAPLLPIHQLSLYNIGRMSQEQVIAAFAARRQQFDRIVADLAAEKPKSRAQHHLIVGQRGMGKTMLLARIAAELRTDSELSTRFIPLVFAEEQYAVDRLSKFWLNCLDSLADARELAGDTKGVGEIDETVARLTSAETRAVKDDQPFADEVYEAFAEAAKGSGQRPVLLVDNLQLVFERLDNGQQHSLRELLMRPGSPILVGASPSPPPQSQDYGAAFYDHFKVYYLRPLDETEMRSLLVHLADVAKRDDVRQRVLKHPARLTVLRQLTGGNPRTTLTLFFLYAEDFAPSVFGDLEGLLDRVTPLYKARFEELTPQQQVVASAIANHWDPVTAAVLAATTGLPSGTISSQIDRLEKTGFIERTELFGETRTGYQLAERFFNIWFLMRSASRRQRREVEFLTRFLESFYEPADRSRLARHLMREDHFSPDRYVWSRAVAASLTEPETAEELTRHAELTALQEDAYEARARLRELIDFDSLPPATLAFDELRKKLMSLIPDDTQIAPEEFTKAVLGDRTMFMSGERERLAARSGKLSTAEIRGVLETTRKARAADEERYSAETVEWFSQRLASGQIRAPRDVDDWNRAFHQASGRSAIQLMVDSIPDGFGTVLTDSSVAIIREAIQPDDIEKASRWYRWGHQLDIKLVRFAEAEIAYRKAIILRPKWSLVWTALGNLLTDHLERFEEAETAYHTAIDLDPKDPWPWNGLGNLLQDHLERFDEAETAYRTAIAVDPNYVWPWNGLGNLLQDHLERFDEAETAYRTAIALDPNNASLWNGLGDLLQDHRERFDEAEVAYRTAIALDPKDALLWNGLGNLYCDHLQRLSDAADVYDTALRLDPTNEFVRQNRLFLRRDFMGEGQRARPLMDDLQILSSIWMADTTHLHEALFAAYDSNWGLARESLAKALVIRADGFKPFNTDDWLRASAVLLHLNYGAELLALLDERGDTVRLRPWVEALRALHAGDRRALQNIAPEIRTTAEIFYDGIESRMKKLPESTRRGATTQPKQRRPRQRRGN
jgi:tetratricopeptide (TPR) repeat protein